MTSSVLKISLVAAVSYYANKTVCWHPLFTAAKFLPEQKVPWDSRVTKHGEQFYYLDDPINKCSARYARNESNELHIESCQDGGVLTPNLKELVNTHENRS